MNKPALPDPTIAFLGLVDSKPAPKPIAECILKLHGDVILERRAFRREENRSVPRPDVLQSINERLAAYGIELDATLDALVWHSEDWAHLPDMCRICTGEVRL